MYSRNQQMFGLSMLANLVTGETGTAQQLQSMLDVRIAENLEKYKDQFGNWKLVKSGLYQAPDSVVADNVLFLAQNQNDTRDFVLAIAATNAISVWDWILEDTAVTRTIPWDLASPKYTPKTASAPAITYGTYVGLKILLRLFQSISTTFPEQNGFNITVVGHSLGGALAPVLALWLEENFRADNVSCFSSAGPTPGNGDFADLYNSTINDTTMVRNSLDLVLRAWCHCGCLNKLPTLYAPYIPKTIAMSVIAGLALDLAEGKDYTHVEFSQKSYEGEINHAIISPTARPFENYLAQVSYQHVDAYFEHFEMDDLLPILQAVRKRTASGADVALAIIEKRLHAAL